MTFVNDAVIAASLTTAAGGLAYLARGIRALIRKSDRQDELIFGDGTSEHPGLERWQRETTSAIRTVEARQEDLHHELDAVHAQLKPNGGSSLRDAVNRVEQVVTAIPRQPGQEDHT